MRSDSRHVILAYYDRNFRGPAARSGGTFAQLDEVFTLQARQRYIANHEV